MPEAGLMRGKRGLILGVANNRSIAWGIAKAAHAQGAQLAFTYQGDALKKRVEPLAAEVGGLVVGHCDVTDESTLDAAFAAVAQAWGSLDLVLLVHFGGATRRETDAAWRRAAHPHLLRRREMDAALQRDGGRQGRAGS